MLLFGVITGLQAVRGRGVSDLPNDLGDIVTGAVTGNYDAVREVLDRRGESFTAAEANYGDATVGSVIADGVSVAVDAGADASPNGVKLLRKVEALGSGKRYVLGSQGPNTYDCSSLVWAAMRDLGMYSGARFTTATWKSVAATLGAKKVTSPAVGDIAWWPGHMGVVDNPAKGTYFSARSPKWGINSSSIDTTTRSRGASGVEYWRLP